jgi:hypothetical protein
MTLADRFGECLPSHTQIEGRDMYQCHECGAIVLDQEWAIKHSEWHDTALPPRLKLREDFINERG